MSIYDKASLVLIPSGTKTSKVYSQKPTNGDGDFTFSRSTAATRVNASGNIEKETSNLLLQSNTFSNAVWAGASTTETSGQSGYDGTNNAWLLEKLVANGNISQSVSANNLMTYSVYAKASTRDWLRLNIVGVANAYFDLANGVVGSTGGSAAITSAMVDAGGGWYRCSFTYNVASTTGVSIYVADADNDSSGTSGNIYIQDAQLNQGLIAQEVITTTTTAIYGGITDNVPRLDYTDSSCPSLLLEPQRTNKITQSEYFQSSWIDNGNIYYDFGYLAPDGTNSAYKITGNDNGYLSFAGVLNNDTRSVYARTTSGTGTLQLLTYFGNTNNTFTITEEWQRFDISSVTTSTGEANFYLADFRGSSSLDEVILWGAQCEAGSYATSYIPTYGSAVTRNLDYLPIRSDMQDFLGTDTGTWFFHINDMFFDITGTGVGSFVLTYTSTELIEVIQDGNDQYKITLNNSIAVQDLDGEDKVAISWSSAGLVIYVNGSSAYTTTSTAYSNAYASLEINKVTRPARVDLKQMMLFPTRLTNAELATLTTI